MNALIIACWVGFFGYWVWSSREVKPAQERQSSASRARHAVLLAAAYVLLAGRFQRFDLGLRLLPDRILVTGLGAALTLLGLAAAVWARRTLGGNWSSEVSLKQGHELVQRGPYGWVRNPIYTSMLIMILGTAIARGRIEDGLGLVLATLSFWIKLKQEEVFMARQFPVEFPAYVARVKALVPFLF